MRNDAFESSEDGFFEPDFHVTSSDADRIELESPAIDWRRFLRDRDQS